MFTKFFERRKQKALEREIVNDPLTMLLMHNVKKNWDEVGILSSLSEEATKVHHADFFAVVQSILGASNILEELRLQISNYVIAYSQHMTLVITPDDKPYLFIKDSPYVSGELNQHLGRDGTSEIEKFKEIYFNYPSISPEELREIATLSMAIVNFFVEGLDLVRIHFEDYNKLNHKKDWLSPFKIAMAENAEYEHREKLGLDNLMDRTMWLKRSIFIQKVLTEPSPLMAYEEAIKKVDQID